MNEENTKKLYDKYPLIYSGHTRPMSETQMCWNFQCDDGWFDLLDTFSALAEAYAQHHELDLEVTCVKEKFGRLRIHLSPCDDVLFNLTQLIESESSRTCEHCGVKDGQMDSRLESPIYERNFAKVRTDGEHWLFTLCEVCRKEKDKNKQGEAKCS